MTDFYANLRAALEAHPPMAEQVKTCALRDAQHSLLDAIYELTDEPESKLLKELANIAYEHNLRQAEQSGLIHTADLHEADPDLAEVYHNVYKSEHGVRPRGHITRAAALRWLEPFREAA
jgi:hypothetical protein